MDLYGGKVTAGAATINVGGNWNNTGSTFTPGTSSVSLNASTGAEAINLNNQSFNNLSIDGAVPSGSGGYWPMDESTGSSVADASGNNNNGTAYNTSIIAGKIGNARQLASNGYIDLNTTTNFNNGQNYTVTAWVKGGADSAYIFEKGNDWTQSGSYGIQTASGGVCSRQMVSAYGALQSDCNYNKDVTTDGNWHFVVSTLSGQTFNYLH